MLGGRNMAKKEPKTNAMRILEKEKIQFEIHRYECEEFTDGVAIADTLGQPHEKVFKTLVTEGKSKEYFVFVIPIAEELDLKKAARAVGEKAVEMIHVKDINKVTGYIRGGCTAIGMKKDLYTVVDESARNLETLIVSGGKRGTQVELNPADYLKACRGSTADLIKDKKG